MYYVIHFKIVKQLKELTLSCLKKNFNHDSSFFLSLFLNSLRSTILETKKTISKKSSSVELQNITFYFLLSFLLIYLPLFIEGEMLHTKDFKMVPVYATDTKRVKVEG